MIKNPYKKNLRKIAFLTNLDLYNMNFKISLNEKVKVSIVSQEEEAGCILAQVFL